MLITEIVMQKVNMLIGMPLWYGDIRNSSFLEQFERAKSLGFDYVELSLDYPIEYPTKKHIADMESAKQKTGLGIAFHGPWAAIELAHPREEIRTVGVKIVGDLIKSVAGIEPLYFNIHTLASIATFQFDEVRDTIQGSAKKSVSSLFDISKKLKVPLTVENNTKLIFGLPFQMEQMLKEVKGISLCLDIGHAILGDYHAKHSHIKDFSGVSGSPEEWFRRLSKSITVVHLNDVSFGEGRPVDHLLLGKGDLDMDEICGMIKKSSCKHVLLETFYSKGRKILATEQGWKNTLETAKKFLS